MPVALRPAQLRLQSTVVSRDCGEHEVRSTGWSNQWSRSQHSSFAPEKMLKRLYFTQLPATLADCQCYEPHPSPGQDVQVFLRRLAYTSLGHCRNQTLRLPSDSGRQSAPLENQ